MIVPLFNETSLVYSPQWNMGENLMAHPLPQRIDGKVYVPLAFLEKAVALLVLRIGQTLGNEGHYFPSKTDVLMSLEESEGALHIRYIPSAVEMPPTENTGTEERADYSLLPADSSFKRGSARSRR